MLGLISSTLEGVEILEEFEWQSVCTTLGHPTGLCVPSNLAYFIHVSFSMVYSRRNEADDCAQTPLWVPPPTAIPESLLLGAPTSNLERKILVQLSHLSNHIEATKASKLLTRLKESASLATQRRPSPFRSAALLFRALEMLANHHFRLNVRRFVWELFGEIKLSEARVREVMDAGEELRIAGADRVVESEAASGGWPRIGTGRRGGLGLTKGVSALHDGFSDDEGADASDVLGSSSSGSDDDDGGAEARKALPLQYRIPLVSVRGFLLS